MNGIKRPILALKNHTFMNNSKGTTLQCKDEENTGKVLQSSGIGI